ncbi:uncharacterized protein LOC135806290 [Sycon ciliatum]|uniref:uncharacterized protein LOC135806290 n=1 Tax=Sycon ciliatum TaxID=27933 RepID=UPI0031F702F7
MASGQSSSDNPFQSSRFRTNILVPRQDPVTSSSEDAAHYTLSVTEGSVYDIPSPLVMQLVSAEKKIETDDEVEGSCAPSRVTSPEIDDLGKRIRESVSEVSDCLADLTTVGDDPHRLYRQMLQSQGLDCPVQEHPTQSGSLIATGLATGSEHDTVAGCEGRSPAAPCDKDQHRHKNSSSGTGCNGDSADDDDDEEEEDIFTAPGYVKASRTGNSSAATSKTSTLTTNLDRITSASSDSDCGKRRTSSSSRTLYERPGAPYTRPKGGSKTQHKTASREASNSSQSSNSNRKKTGLQFSIPSGLFSPGPELKSKGYRLFRESTGSMSSDSRPSSTTPRSRGPSPACDCECGKCGKKIGRHRTFFESLSLSPVVEKGDPENPCYSPSSSRAGSLQRKKGTVTPPAVAAAAASSIDDKHRIVRQQRRLGLLWVAVAGLAIALIFCVVALAVRKAKEFEEEGSDDGGPTKSLSSSSSLVRLTDQNNGNTSQNNCTAGWTWQAGKCVRLSPMPGTHASAQANCDRMGGSLIAITSQAEADAFRYFAGIDIWIHRDQSDISALVNQQQLPNVTSSQEIQHCPVLSKRGYMIYTVNNLCSTIQYFLCEQHTVLSL